MNRVACARGGRPFELDCAEDRFCAECGTVTADLERAKAAIARADVIAGCVRATRGKGPAELERALLAAGIDAITADAIARFGWRDPRTALRRAVAKLQRQLASEPE